MVKVILLIDYIVGNEDTQTITVIPKGTELLEAYDGAMFSTFGNGEIKNPKFKMTIGCNWIYNNPTIFKVIKIKKR